jgi:hypothetical protein
MAAQVVPQMSVSVTKMRTMIAGDGRFTGAVCPKVRQGASGLTHGTDLESNGPATFSHQRSDT